MKSLLLHNQEFWGHLRILAEPQLLQVMKMLTKTNILCSLVVMKSINFCSSLQFRKDILFAEVFDKFLANFGDASLEFSSERCVDFLALFLL